MPSLPRNPLRRSAPVPPEVLARAVATGALARGEKVLAHTVADDGTWLLGTRDALLIVEMGPVPVEMGPVRVEMGPVPVEMGLRVPWERIETAEWNRDTGRLSVVEVGEFDQVRPSYSFETEDPGLLAQLIRERVTASVVTQRRVVVSGKRGLNVVARRAPHGMGPITWAYEFDTGVEPDDPEVMRLARQGLAAAAEELGL